MSECKISRVTDANIPDLQTFINTHWKADHIMAIDSELLRWQYGAVYDEKEEYTCLLAMSGDQVAGFCGHIPVAFRTHESIMPGVWFAMLMVAPEFRGARIASRFLQEIQAQYRVVSIIGISEPGKFFYRKHAFSLVDAVPRYVWFPGAAWREARRSGKQEIPYVGTDRNARYISWRYRNHPTFRYEILETKDPSATLVYRREHVTEWDADVIRVVDLFGSEAGLYDLLEEAQRQDSVWMDCLCAHKEFQRVLGNAGFVEADRFLPSKLQPVDAEHIDYALAMWDKAGADLIDRSDILVTKGDGDADRPNERQDKATKRRTGPAGLQVRPF